MITTIERNWMEWSYWGNQNGFYIYLEAKYPPQSTEKIFITSSRTAKRLVDFLSGEMNNLELPVGEMHSFPIEKPKGRRITTGCLGFSLRDSEAKRMIQEISEYFLLRDR